MCDQGGIFSVAGQKMTSTVVIFHRPIGISSVLLPPETRKNQKRVEPSPPYRKKLPFQVESVPPCQVKEGRSGGTADGEEDIYQKIFSRFIFSLATRKSSCSARAFSSPDELETSSASTYFMAFAMHWSISSSSSELMNIRATSW